MLPCRYYDAYKKIKFVAFLFNANPFNKHSFNKHRVLKHGSGINFNLLPWPQELMKKITSNVASVITV